ncbi:MAG TPA: cyclodeaminase/cyclohydrolase family protein [Candidatus Limnocylindrales bacterium]
MPETPTKRFRDLTIDGFVEHLSSASPAPGGGAASAIAASLGASLVAMVAGLSEGRERYSAHEEAHTRSKAAGLELADRLLQIADDDATAYDEFARALKLPRETDEQKAARTAAVRAAARVAAEIPLLCVEACVEIVRASEALAGRSNRNASSDLNVASLLAEAAVRGAAENVFVNIPALGDEAYGEELRRRAEAGVAAVEDLARRTREAVASGVEREPLPGGVAA